MSIAGKSDVLKTTTAAPTTTTSTELPPSAWVPEALTVPPETTTLEPTTTTEAPYYLAWKIPKQLENGTIIDVYRPLPRSLAETVDPMIRNNETITNIPGGLIVKVLVTEEILAEFNGFANSTADNSTEIVP